MSIMVKFKALYHIEKDAPCIIIFSFFGAHCSITGMCNVMQCSAWFPCPSGSKTRMQRVLGGVYLDLVFTRG